MDPMSSVIAQMDGRHVRVLDEIVLRNGTTQEACAEFLERYERHEAGVAVYGDASGYAAADDGGIGLRRWCGSTSGCTRSTAVQYRVPKANPRVRERVNLVNAKLRSASGEIGLVMDRKCRELIKDFEQVMYKADSGQIDKERDRMGTHFRTRWGICCGRSAGPG